MQAVVWAAECWESREHSLDMVPYRKILLPAPVCFHAWGSIYLDEWKFNILLPCGHYFSVHVSADLTSFDFIWIHASGEVRGKQPNRHAGLGPKTLKNPFLAFFYSDSYTLYNLIPLPSCLKREVLEPLCFMNPYVLVIVAATTANARLRKSHNLHSPMSARARSPVSVRVMTRARTRTSSLAGL